MLIERERACDDLVLSHGAEAPAYARHLLNSVSTFPTPRLAAAAVAMARPSTLEERMRAILDHRMNRRAMSMRGSVATILLLLVALLPAAVLRAQVETREAPRSTTPPPPATVGGSVNDADHDAPPPPPRESRPAPGGGATTGGRGRAPGGFPQPGAGGGGYSGGAAFGAGGNGYGGGFGGTSRGGGFGGSSYGPMGPGGPGAQGDGPTCTFDVTIYDVRIPVEQIGKLDVEALANASQTAADFEKALASLGTSRPMYRVNQSVRLSGDNVTIGSEVPIVTNSRTTDRGQAINTVNYQSVGARFSIASSNARSDGVDLDLGIEVSSSSDTGTAISENVSAPIMRRATMSHKGPVQPKKPFVIVSVDANSVDKAGKAVAYIGRVTLGEPRQPAGNPGPGGHDEGGDHDRRPGR
jgi:hypothetical protein